MKNIIIGTAGHVDHGKTQLIKALSGIDTDRLAEEKKRGITIELGFAHIPNDEGYNIGVIDVPGHEKFIRNMLAGIGGIDFVLFVVAADEGIMPQTKEHFEILQALGIDDGIVAVTKIDMVEPDWLEMVMEDIGDYFRGSFLEGQPMIPVSSKTGENIDLLKQEILKKCDREIKRDETPEMFRLPVDRVFVKAGFGTIVTGTLIDGTCQVNEEVRIDPSGQKVKIRGIQTYGHDTEAAVAGQRTAINLSGVSKDEVRRGDVIAAEDAVCVTGMIDVRLRVFDSSDRTILNNSRVHLYCGSSETLCKVVLMDRDSLSAGEEAYAQLRMEAPVAVKRGDRFIVRFYSPVITIAGGVMLDVLPDKHKRNRENVLEQLRIMDQGTPEEIADMKANSRHFYNAASLAHELGMRREKMDDVIEKSIAAGRIAKLDDGTLIGTDRLTRLTETLQNMMQDYHEQNPLAEGMPKQELSSRLRDLWHIEEERIVQALVRYLLQNGVLADYGKEIALRGFEAAFTPEQEQLMDRILGIYRSAGIEIPKNDEIFALDRDRRVIQAIFTRLTEKGQLVKVDPSYYISAEGWNQVVRAARELGAKGSFVLADFRDYLGTSRKYAAVYLQSLDRAGVTVFDGERRSVPK